ALAELLLDLADGEIDRPLAIYVDAHVTPSPARCCYAPGPLFPEMRLLYPGPQPVSSTAGYIFSGTPGPQRVRRDGNVEGTRRPEAALVEHDVRGGPRAEGGHPRGGDGLGQLRPAPRRADTAEREVAAK